MLQEILIRHEDASTGEINLASVLISVLTWKLDYTQDDFTDGIVDVRMLLKSMSIALSKYRNLEGDHWIRYELPQYREIARNFRDLCQYIKSLDTYREDAA
jgi:hypothetical protein